MCTLHQIRVRAATQNTKNEGPRLFRLSRRSVTTAATFAFRWQYNTETVSGVFRWNSPVARFVFIIPASHFGFLSAILRQTYLAWPVRLTTVQHSLLAQCSQLLHWHKGSRDHRHERSVPHSASLGWNFISRRTECAMENVVNYIKKYKKQWLLHMQHNWLRTTLLLNTSC